MLYLKFNEESNMWLGKYSQYDIEIIYNTKKKMYDYVVTLKNKQIGIGNEKHIVEIATAVYNKYSKSIKKER